MVVETVGAALEVDTHALQRTEHRRADEGRRQPGRRRQLSARPFRGRQVGHAPAGPGPFRDVAWGATLRGAAVRSRSRASGRMPLTVLPSDLEVRRRWCRPSHLINLVVDVSGSMGGALLALGRQVALRVLEDAYVRRERVAMIVFRDRSAALLFGPTTRTDGIHRALAGLETGGTTPLAEGLVLAHQTLDRAERRLPGQRATTILITDGKGNVGQARGQESLARELELVSTVHRRRTDRRVIVLDATPRGADDRAASRLCRLLGAKRLRLHTLSDPVEAESVDEIVRRVRRW